MARFMSRLIVVFTALIFLLFLMILFSIGQSDLWVATIFLILSGIWFCFSYLHVLKQNMEQARNYLLMGFGTFFISIVLYLFILR